MRWLFVPRVLELPNRCFWRIAFAATALLFACAASAATIRGTVFEDVDYGGGAGRSLSNSGGIGVGGARVELYREQGNDFDYIAVRTTSASGAYSFSGLSAGSYRVRVVNGSISSSRAACSACVPVQTFRTDASSGTALAVTNRVGGEDPRLSDAPNRPSGDDLDDLTLNGVYTPQSIAEVTVDSGSWLLTVDDVDFGFNFDTIVNTRDATSCGPSGTYFRCQGSLRQFIINSNALTGEGSLAQDGGAQIDGSNASLPAGYETSIFMIPDGTVNPGHNTGYANQLTNGIAEITLAGALPNISGTNTRLDASTQTINVGNTNSGTVGSGGTVGVDAVSLPTIAQPEVQLNCAASGAIDLTGSNQSILAFALRQGYISLAGPNGTARNNLVGMHADGNSGDASSAAYGIEFSAPNATIRNNFVTVNNSAIRSDGGGSGSIVTLNEVARPSAGHTNTFDGILLINGAANVQIIANLVRDQAGGAIELGFGSSGDSYMNVLVANNTVTNNGFTSGTTPSAEPVGMVGYNYTGMNVSFYRNVVTSNAGAGLLLMAASGTSASQNRFSSNGGLSIDLDPVARDPNNLGPLAGATINDNGDADSGPNSLLNFPVITSAVVTGGQLTISGYARPNSVIELYLAEADPSGFGEGQVYLGSFVEGTPSDLNATTGAYGPAAINGRLQGTDTTNRFAFSIAVPASVALGTALTSTATLAGQTSEFGGNVVVSSGASLTHVTSVTLISDPLNGTTNPKSIPGAIQLYTMRVTNQGSGSADNNSLLVVDEIPGNTAFVVTDVAAPGSGPVAFVDGSPSSGLTYSFVSFNSATDAVEFSSDGGASWTHTPTPNADGCDPAVTHVRIRPQGAMSGNSGGGAPYFEIRFAVRVD